MSGDEGRGVISHEAADGVGVITIDRPERRNALNLEVKEGIARAVEAETGVRPALSTGGGTSISGM